MKPNLFLLSARKVLHAYNSLCEPLLEQFELSQVSFDILMFLANNPEYSTAQEISEIRNIKRILSPSMLISWSMRGCWREIRLKETGAR